MPGSGGEWKPAELRYTGRGREADGARSARNYGTAATKIGRSRRVRAGGLGGPVQDPPIRNRTGGRRRVGRPRGAGAAPRPSSAVSRAGSAGGSGSRPAGEAGSAPRRAG